MSKEVDHVVFDAAEPKWSSEWAGYEVARLHRTHEPVTVAKIAVEMATRWGIVAAAPDGEDSAGRQKARLRTADELAVAACETAQALWLEFHTRGWLVEVPFPKRVKKTDKEKADLL